MSGVDKEEGAGGRAEVWLLRMTWWRPDSSFTACSAKQDSSAMFPTTCTMGNNNTDIRQLKIRNILSYNNYLYQYHIKPHHTTGYKTISHNAPHYTTSYKRLRNTQMMIICYNTIAPSRE